VRGGEGEEEFGPREGQRKKRGENGNIPSDGFFKKLFSARMGKRGV